MYKNFIILVVASIGVMILVIFGLSYVKFQLFLTPQERNVLLFSHEKIQLKERQVRVVQGLKSPIILTSTKAGYPGTQLMDIAPIGKQEGQRLTFILINGNKRMAVIDNLVVKEGDMISQGRVARIERDGILIKSKEGEQWLKIN